MTQFAERIHTDQAQIQALEALILQLPGQAHVRIELHDGSVCFGTVSVRPSIQQFRDAEGNEGSNAQVRIDDLDDPARHRYLWLDQIRSVRQLPPRPWDVDPRDAAS
ncbi:DUF3247 family protein [Xanthomonas sp. D-109]|uniref:DUF3247 family protein n=1 Tax=Xanthomonas sp. D-109 TaxID=2821274 RepID=UPI001ADCBE0D|nr:DUF3247 family protein [Xanthomonas sp. D-109]MBO9882760.1 DUF3247 family protein [Xanthomonas sp. D-109]MCC4589766.1 DUF3247 family protein [Xanthomonas campestris pv. cannae]